MIDREREEGCLCRPEDCDRCRWQTERDADDEEDGE